MCNDFVSNIRRDALEGLTIPADWELKLLSTGGSRQFDTSKIVKHYDTRIAMTVLADFLFLGDKNSGSWALSSDKTKLFSMAIGAYLDMICEVFNRKAIPELIELNCKIAADADGLLVVDSAGDVIPIYELEQAAYKFVESVVFTADKLEVLGLTRQLPLG